MGLNRKQGPDSSDIRRQGSFWAICTLWDAERNAAIQASIFESRLRGFYSILYADLERGKCSEELRCSRALGRSSFSSDDYDICFYSERMTIAFVKRGHLVQMLITAPFLSLPSGEIGLKADFTFSEETPLKGLRKLDDEDGLWFAGRISGCMKGKGTLFIEHVRRDIEASGSISLGGGKLPRNTQERCIELTSEKLSLYLPDAGKAIIITDKAETIPATFSDNMISGSITGRFTPLAEARADISQDISFIRKHGKFSGSYGALSYDDIPGFVLDIGRTNE